MMGFNPDDLAHDADNYDVWCERCQRVHKFYPMTREDYDRVIAQAAKNLADEIDKRFIDDATRLSRG